MCCDIPVLEGWIRRVLGREMPVTWFIDVNQYCVGLVASPKITGSLENSDLGKMFY